MVDFPDATPDLPAELHDAIIDYLHDDKATLANCSLVCSSWSRPSRLYLFHRLSIRGETQGRGFLDFLAFLADGAAPVVEFVKEIKYSVRRGRLAKESAIRCVGPYDFASLLHFLPSLHTFEMESLSWDRNRVAAPNGETLDPWPSARAFRKVSITRCVSEHSIQHRLFRSLDLIPMFALLAPLQRLELISMNVNYSLKDEVQPITVHPEFKLQELCLHTTHLLSPGAHVDGVYASMSPYLRKLDIICRSDDEAPMVGRILRAVGRDLEELQLNLSELQATRSFSQVPPWVTFSLGEANALTEFHLHVFTTGAHIFGDVVFTHNGQWCLCSVGPILSCLTAPLRRIHIVLSMSGTTTRLRSHLATTMDWAGLASQLERFEEVERIVVELRQRKEHNISGDAFSVIGGLVEARLPSLVQRGVLEVWD